MKNIISALFISIACSCAFAEWVFVTNSEDGKLSRYVDPESVRGDGTLVRLWELSDFKNNPIIYPDKKKANSMKSQSEWDCKQELWRMLYNIPFTGQMAAGSPINTYDGEKKWYPVSPGSTGQSMFEFACGKR